MKYLMKNKTKTLKLQDCYTMKIHKLGSSQDVPFDLILWYIAKTSYLVGINPLLD